MPRTARAGALLAPDSSNVSHSHSNTASALTPSLRVFRSAFYCVRCASSARSKPGMSTVYPRSRAINSVRSIGNPKVS